MNSPRIIHIINAKSWNDNWFTYNVEMDRWELNAIVNKQHYATDADISAAKECAEREGAQFRDITLEEYDYDFSA